MDEQDARGESHLGRERHHFLRFLRRAGADHAADRDVKLGVIAQGDETFAQIIQHLLRGVVSLHAVDRDLHFLQPGGVQFLDQLRL